jgi:hypothetical protein
MYDFKNFQLAQPTPKQLKAYTDPETEVVDNILFLKSEDGHDWYECQNLFADDTIKIMYDSDGIIRSVVDEPVPDRGNILAVSMFWPEGMSVAEVESLPAGFDINGTWAYSDGAITQSTDAVTERNKRSLNRRLNVANNFFFMYQSCQEVGTSQDGDNDYIQQLQQYASDLRAVDLSASAPAWPTPPSFII